MIEPAVVVEGLSKRYRVYAERNRSLKATLLTGRHGRYEDFWALRDVSFEIPTGATFGLIGENGSGKSTLLKCLARILLPDEGRARTSGKVAALLELGSGFHPELTGRENVFLNGSILGLSRRQLEQRLDAIVDFSGIEPFIDQPVKNYSSGMYVRLGFSIAINVEPDILLVDEILAVGDAAFQRKCEERFSEFRQSGRTVVLVSHAMGSMRALCEEVAWLEHGRLMGVGSPFELVDRYVDETHEDRVVTQQGRVRWGSGEVQVDRVELLDADDRPRTSVRTGDPVTLRIHYAASRPVERPVFGFAVESLDGAYIWAHNSRDGDVEVPLIEGRGHVDLEVARLMLQPGVFNLAAAITAHDGAHVYDHVKQALRFDVGFGQPRESGGYLALGGAWQSPVPSRQVSAQA
ncbi:MAG: ABC transporter ATP-binding protein [Actinobacteria bacterium]|nr:ABC transporter ATP-binding protein [Actinomycetota bacterium]MCA1720560.1 ABC transporter ATP-binding protein [Actinomycetota bacterium]